MKRVTAIYAASPYPLCIDSNLSFLSLGKKAHPSAFSFSPHDSVNPGEVLFDDPDAKFPWGLCPVLSGEHQLFGS